MNFDAPAVTQVQVQANRLDVLSRLADDLAHEVKNPLNAMVINLELVRRRIATSRDDEALERLVIVEEETGRVHELVEALLQVLRPPREAAARVEIGGAIGELMPLLRARAKLSRVEFSYEPAPEPVRAPVRRDALKHAVLNLVANAFEALEPGSGRVELQVESDAGEARIRVRDSGAGLSTEAAERVGEPGFSTRPGHTGLGLAVARGIAEQAGGRLELEEAGGRDRPTVFLFAVPRLNGA